MVIIRIIIISVKFLNLKQYYKNHNKKIKTEAKIDSIYDDMIYITLIKQNIYISFKSSKKQ